MSYFAGGFDEEASPLGAKGLGKLTAAASVAPAIADAVYHATGKRVRDLPVTAEKLLYAIPHDGMQNTYGRDQKERSPCLNQSDLKFSSLAVGLAASLSLGTWRNRDGGLPSWSGGGSAAPVRTSPACRARMRFASAKVAHLARHGAEFGTMTGSVTVDMATVRRRKREMVERQIATAPAELQGERRRTDHGQRAFCSAENPRSELERRRNARAGRRQDLP